MMGEPEWRSQLQHAHSNNPSLGFATNNFYAGPQPAIKTESQQFNKHPNEQRQTTTTNYVKNFARFGAASNSICKPNEIDLKTTKNYQRTASANSAQNVNANSLGASSTLTILNKTRGNNSSSAGLDYTTTTESSSSNSGIEYKRRHRCTLPSITTTSKAKNKIKTIL